VRRRDQKNKESSRPLAVGTAFVLLSVESNNRRAETAADRSDFRKKSFTTVYDGVQY